jgi:uncharacterized protein (UPF0335 family)
MEIRTTEEARTNIEDFTKRYINLQMQKKALDADIKALKDEFKEEGVPVGIVTSVINKIKSEKKKSDSEIFEEETIKEWLQSNPEIDNEIGALIAK